MVDSVESFREVDRADVQRYTPLTTTLLQYSVHHEVVATSMVRPETSLVKRLYFAQTRSKSGI